ncbi:hypothetical protein D3C79_924370 [compost metagenome]
MQKRAAAVRHRQTVTALYLYERLPPHPAAIFFFFSCMNNKPSEIMINPNEVVNLSHNSSLTAQEAEKALINV